MKIANAAGVLACMILVFADSGRSDAAESFDINWEEYSYGSLGSCNSGGIVAEGIPFFHGNGVPIPTFTLQGYPISYPNRDRRGKFEAPFSSSILRLGSNAFTFDFALINDSSHCDISDHLISLTSRGGQPRQLFNVQIRGAEFHGATTTRLSLREIDPQLADDLDRWKKQLDDEIRALSTAARDQAEYLRRLSRLEALGADIDGLFEQGFGEVTPEELLAVLDNYADLLSPEAQAALVDLLSSFRRDIEDLRAELDRINTELANQTEALNTLIDSQATQTGFDTSNPNNYTPQADPSRIPTVPTPTQPGGDPFDPTQNPYAAMANSVTAAVQATLDGQGVRDRDVFLQMFVSWRRNISDIERSFLNRAWISQAEYTAFLNARNQVLNLFRTYVDDDGWIRDAPIPAGLKPLIDLLIVLHMDRQASELKLSLNMWRGQLTERQQLILDALRGLRAAVEANKAALAIQQQDEQHSIWSSILDNAVVVVRSAVLALTPVGDFVDLCEIITGRELCMPDGRELSVTERMLSGAGLVAGSGAMWAAVAGIVRKSEKVTKKLSDILDELRILTPRKNIIRTDPLPGGKQRFFHRDGHSAIFDRDGFPDFREHLTRDLRPGQKATANIELSGVRATDERLANAQAGFRDGTPDCCTWHHDKKLGTMLLIPTEIHEAFRHTGGVAIWEKITGQKYR